jgi:hypothetical protein
MSGFRVDLGSDDGSFQPLGTGETFTLSGTWDDVLPVPEPIGTVKLFPKAVRIGRIHLYPGHYEMTAPEMRRDGMCSFAFMVQRSRWVPASLLRRLAWLFVGVPMWYAQVWYGVIERAVLQRQGL